MKIKLLIAGICLASMAVAQNNRIIIDLSVTGKYEQSIETGKIDTLWIINKLPGDKISYELSVKKTRIAQPAFELPSKALTGTEKAVAGAGGCVNLEAALKVLSNATNETEVAALVEKLQTAMKETDQSNCKIQLKDAQNVIDRTRELKGLAQAVNMLDDETLTVKVKRTKPGENDRSWEFQFHTPVKRWKVYYGFTYSPDLFSGESTYYAKSTSDTAKFIITRGRKENGKNTFKNLTPTVMFSYLFTRKDHDIKFAGTGGVSLDLSNPSAMIGPSIVIGENLSLNVGLVARQKDRLLLKYSNGDEIGEDLGFDQLHEKIWKAEFFFSIGFRFNKNPFAESESKDE